MCRRDIKLLREPRTLSFGQLSPLPMETDETFKKLQTALPPAVLLQANEKSFTPVYTELSMSTTVQNGSSPPPGLTQNEFRVKSTSPPNDSTSILVQTSTPSASTSATTPGAASYQLPIVLNNLQGTSQSNNIFTLLQPAQSIVNPNPQRQTQILLDVAPNSLTQLQQFGAKNLNGVIPIQLNLATSQHLQQQQPQQQPQQQQQQSQTQQQQPQQQIHLQLQPQQIKQAHTQVVYNSQQLQLLHATTKQQAQTQSQQMIITSLSNDNQIPVANCAPIVFSKVIEPPNALSSTPVTLQIQQPGIAQTKISGPHLMQKEGAQITLDNRPVISYTQVSSAMPQAPKALITPNGICQMENVHIAGNAWVKDSPGDLHAIPVISTTLSPHFSFDPAFELGQRRRKKRAVFAPQVRRALEVAFEQNTRPSRRELEFLAGKLGLLFEEVRVWFCNKRQKERQQLQLSVNDHQHGDTCGDSFNSFFDGSPPPQAVAPQHAFEDSLHEHGFHVKEEFDSDCMLPPPRVSDTSQLEPKDLLMPTPIDSEINNHSLEPNFISVAKNSIA